MNADWRGARVLVTGGRGFIAKHLCRRLVASGAVVHAVSQNVTEGPLSAITWWRADLTDLTQVRQLVSNVAPDVVFHLAGHVTGAQGLDNVQPTFLVNLASTVHLLTTAAEKGGCRVILAGSMQEPTDATTIPCSPYAVSKWACTGYAQMFHSLYDLPVVVVRPMMVYGPEQWDLSKLLPYVTISFLKGVAPRIGSGGRELDWVYVDDIVEGLLTMATRSDVLGQAIDLGSGELTSVRRIVERVGAIVGSSIPAQFGAAPDRVLERPRAAHAEATRALTGWTASMSLEDGLARTVAWYRGQLEQGAI